MAKGFQQPAAIQQHFTTVPQADIERSRFDRSHGHKLTLMAGELVPIYVDEVLPGDSFHLKETSFARLATPLKPVMDNLYLETFYFFVPYRMVWDNWFRFCGERQSYDDVAQADLTIPQCVWNLATVKTQSNSFPNYMGIPMNGAGDVSVSALPFRAYIEIWNTWFRDENVAARIPKYTGDGPDDYSLLFRCPKRGKRHDYFTSALPWPQKGDPVPAFGIMTIQATDTFIPMVKPVGSPSAGSALRAGAGGAVTWGGTPVPSTPTDLQWMDPNLKMDFEAQTGGTINDLRTAFQIQRLLERDARGGTRYIELVLSHFRVSSPDLRALRPVYLGGGRTRVSINPVPSTFQNAEVAQGEMAGYGTAVNRGSWSQAFTEHGIVIGMACLRADLTYQQGLERFWSRKTRYDFYWPALSHLGEQAILNQEIFLSGSANGGVDTTVWGYQERYAEYRYKPSRISGQFSSGDPLSLDVWHLAQDFSALPVLNQTFMSEAPPVERILAVPTESHLLMDIWFDLSCERPIPVYSVPGMADHF